MRKILAAVLLCAAPALAQPTLSGTKSDEGKVEAVIVAPLNEKTRLNMTTDGGNTQELRLQLERDLKSGTLKLGVGSQWNDKDASRDVQASFEAPDFWGGTLEADAHANLMDLDSGCKLSLDLNEPLTDQWFVQGGLTSIAEMTPAPERSARMGLGYKFDDEGAAQIRLLVDRDSEGLFEITSSLRKRTEKWGSFKVEAVYKLQLNAETLYRADYQYQLSDRFSVGAEAAIKPELNEFPDVQLKANLRISW